MQSYATLLDLPSQAPWGFCFPRAFHLFRWHFKADVSPGGCTAALCGKLPQETSYRRRKCCILPCPPPGDRALWTANCSCYHGAASREWLSLMSRSGSTRDTSSDTSSSSLFQLWLLFSAVGTNRVFLCLESLSRDLPAEVFHFQPQSVSICSHGLALLCPCERCLIVAI